MLSEFVFIIYTLSYTNSKDLLVSQSNTKTA